jgi:hypothetical protein
MPQIGRLLSPKNAWNDSERGIAFERAKSSFARLRGLGAGDAFLPGADAPGSMLSPAAQAKTKKFWTSAGLLRKPALWKVLMQPLFGNEAKQSQDNSSRDFLV